MRRFLTLVTLAILVFGPFASLLPASAEARLPACCRRAGKHHCAMGADAAQQDGSAKHFSAPRCCPSYPAAVTVITPAFLPGQAVFLQAPVAKLGLYRAESTPRSHFFSRASGRSPPSLA